MVEDEADALPIHEWTGPEADALRKSLEHMTDLQHVVNCCSLLLEPASEDDSPQTQALYESAVITYARCFNSGRRSKITEQTIADTAAPEAVIWHRYFMKMRDQHVAHTVLPHAHLSVGVVTSPLGASPFEVLGSAHMTARRVSDGEEGLQALHALATLLIGLHQQALVEHDAAFVKAAQDAGEEAVRSMPLVSFTVPGTDVDLTPPRGK